MSTPLTKIAWDSNIVIDCLQKKQPRYQWISPMLLEAEAGNLLIVISAISIMETTRIDGKEVHEHDDLVTAFFDKPYVELHAGHRKIAEIARAIRIKHDVDGADSIHLATAAITDTQIFLTNDGDAQRQRNKGKNPTPLLPHDGKIKIPSGVLRIMTPESYDKMCQTAAHPIYADVINKPTSG